MVLGAAHLRAGGAQLRPLVASALLAEPPPHRHGRPCPLVQYGKDGHLGRRLGRQVDRALVRRLHSGVVEHRVCVYQPQVVGYSNRERKLVE